MTNEWAIFSGGENSRNSSIFLMEVEVGKGRGRKWQSEGNEILKKFRLKEP